jgi:hypothetical protein
VAIPYCAVNSFQLLCRLIAIVFDNFKSILSQGGYREGYAGYSELLRRIATEHHVKEALVVDRAKEARDPCIYQNLANRSRH